MLFGLCRIVPVSIALLAISTMIPNAHRAFGQEDGPKKNASPVSFYRQVRPILQRHCSGCHQPAKAGGELLLTSYEGLKKGGDQGEGFVPGKPDESLLIDNISGDEPLMPLKADPLKPEQVALISRWIKEGAKDDTPASLKDKISAENPPTYDSAPVISALAYSQDSKLLAVSGFREILLHKADGSGLVARLIGRSHRIESLDFSPDGKLLAAVGGTPSLFGEVQFWNPVDHSLVQSVSLTADTLFGGQFDNEGKLFAFGSADNRLRVITVKDAKQVMRMDAHSDWVFGADFSVDSKHVISISRDRAMKLTILETGQFVDNITSITPGALKGGLMALQRHPKNNNLLIAGSDGEPKLYKMFRTQARKIGDDFNRLKTYPKMPGRIFDVEFNHDGSQFVACSSTAHAGYARIYNTDETKIVHELKGHDKGLFAVAFRPDGKQVATGGFDGHIRIFDSNTGSLVKEFIPVAVSETVAAAK